MFSENEFTEYIFVVLLTLSTDEDHDDYSVEKSMILILMIINILVVRIILMD